MPKLQNEYTEIMRLTVQDEIFRSHESLYDHQLHGRLLVPSRLSFDQLTELFRHR